MTTPSRPNTFSNDVHLRADILWFVLAAVWIVAFTLAPFELSFKPNELWARLEQTVRIEGGLEPLKIAGHLLSFCLFGIIVGAVFCTRGRWTTLLLPCALGCILLEAAQLFQAERHARLIDLSMNFLALGTGIWFGARTRVGRLCTRYLRADHRPLAQLVVVLGACALWLTIGLRPAFGGLQLNWDRTFPLTVGNEIGGARPWLGNIPFVGIYGQALSRADVEGPHTNMVGPNGFSSGRSNDVLAAYDFRRNSTPEVSPAGHSHGGVLDLLVPPNSSWSTDLGLSPSPFGVVRSRGAANEIADRISAVGAFSVEFWCKPDNLKQVGPARLVSNSGGPAARNFTLGQAGADLVFRVRNHLNGPNGTEHALTASNIFTTTMQHVVATYDHGVSMIYCDGQFRSAVDLREPVFYSGLDTETVGTGALLFLVIVTIALPAVFVFGQIFAPAAARMVTAAFTLLVGLLPYAVTCGIVGGPWRFGFIAAFLTAFALIYPTGLAVISRRGCAGGAA
ncbi:MAG: LamG-like jellyroll fold domain-containing protein [Chthoniobacterales bacterium]